MAVNPKLQAIKAAMEQIQKEYGAGAIMKLGDRTHMEVSVIPTGSLTLDIALGVGGLPRGRITEIYGPEASGKTTLCLHVIAQAQKQGGTAAFIDAEHALDPQRAETIGVKLDDLLISQPDTGEQALEIAETLIRSGAVDVIVVDSVAALVPRAEIEGEMGDSMMGLQARLMSQAMRKLTSAIAKSKAVIIFTNQLRMKIGVMFGNPETTTGGKALKFYASIRLDCRKIGNIQDGDKIVGSRHRVKIVKNKVAAPFRVAEFDILNAGGISRLGDIIDLALLYNIIEKSGSFYRFKGEVIGQGKEAVRDYLGENHKIAKEVETEILQKLKAEEKSDGERKHGRPRKTADKSD
jgi:recombination protein RecA